MSYHFGLPLQPDTDVLRSLKEFTPLPQEDQDAAITGSTRSLTRRLMALNIQASSKYSVSADAVTRNFPAIWNLSKSA